MAGLGLNQHADLFLDLAPLPIQDPLGMGMVTDQYTQLFLDATLGIVSNQSTQLLLIMIGCLDNSKPYACGIPDRPS